MHPSAQGQQDPTLSLPRILCLHGGGTNARIFRAQCRALSAQLRGEFRLVFAEAALPSPAGPDVSRVYGSWGPFRSWLRWHADSQPAMEARHVTRLLDAACDEAMSRDTLLAGATGPWVGLLGFSQGAKVVASMLYRQQLHEEEELAEASSMSGEGEDDDDEDGAWWEESSNSACGSGAWFSSDDDYARSGRSSESGSSRSRSSVFDDVRGTYRSCDRSGPSGVRWRFGVLLAGSGPPVALSLDSDLQTILPDASQLTIPGYRWDDSSCQSPSSSSSSSSSSSVSSSSVSISVPTLHVHGLRDSGLKNHRWLHDAFCHPSSRRLIEWDGEHRVPLLKKDVSPLADGIRELARGIDPYARAAR